MLNVGECGCASLFPPFYFCSCENFANAKLLFFCLAISFLLIGVFNYLLACV